MESAPPGDKAMFELAVEDLGLGEFLQHKLTLSSVQSLLCGELSNVSCHSMKDISMNFLRHLMALNMQEAFRSVNFNREAAHSEQKTSDNISGCVHPLDVLCALLHCSDNFLRKEIIRRMSMCQVPVPLLLPAGEYRDGTFLLWAMRGVMKPSINHSAFIEDSVVNIPLPVFSFISLGECRCKSIAKIIHQTLPKVQQRNQDDVMRWGDMPRCLSDGLVEISWYFPSDQTDLTLLNAPFAVTNLYGDLQSNMKQFHFLTNVSSAVFILAENMTDQQWNLLLKAEGDKKNYYFIVQDQLNQHSSRFCNQFSDFGLDKQNVLVESHENFQENLQLILRNIMQSSPKQMTLSEMSLVASKLDFCSDENQPGCEYARLHSLDLTTDIINAAEYNEGNIKQQKNLKMQISEIEKEVCRLRDQGELHTMDYKSKLMNMYDLQVKNCNNHSDIMTNLCYTFTFMNKEEQKYFLQWIKFQTFSTSSTVSEIIQEDVFCKIAQMYEAEVITGSTEETTRLFAKCPEAAADLLLQGIPLELIDGDTPNIHLKWITDVLSELDTRTKGKCRMRVISVLGVQGTGKSTLLNTMFGLQFPMTHRQCTRGAVMSLIKVEEKDLGCDYLVVIDCEGLRDLDRASAEDSFDHDNELATLVVGLSDFAIINMALGSTSEMLDILQIVVHALLRMKATGQNPNCLLVYQIIKGASPEDITMIEDEEMLHLQIEKNSNFLQYNDTIECNILDGYWTIPPFDLETSCYSTKVVELKQYLLQEIKYISQPGSFRDVQSFAGDIKALWNSVKYENYIFRFKNILEGKIYTELYERFLELEWNLCTKMHRRWATLEDWAYEQPAGELHTSSLVQDVLRMLNEETIMMQDSLQVYFTENSEDTHSYIARKFEVEFMEKMKNLKSQMEANYMTKCSIFKPLRLGLENTIVEDFSREEQDPAETNIDVTSYWNNSLAKYKSMILKHHNVEETFLQLLRQDMRTKGSLVTELIHNISSLSEYVPADFTYDVNYVNKSFLRGKCDHMENCLACHNKRLSTIRFLFEKSYKYVQKVVESETVYDPLHGMTLLNMVNKVIRDDTVPYAVLFELNLKLQILAQSAPHFQKMHDDFLGVCSKQVVDHGAEGINYLEQILQDKRIAKNYCQDWLRPAVELKVKKMFRQRFTNEYTNHMCAMMKSRRRPTEASRELRCVHHAPVEDTLENFCNRYTDRNEIQILLANIISSVIEDIRKVLNHPDVLKSGNVRDLLASVWSVLEDGISGGRDNIANAPFCVPVSSVQCSSYLDFFVKKIEKQIQEEFGSKSIEELYMGCS
ncbi:up-regulator of cell proliferation-like isoform X2 [Bufo bufo]|uniref:up-regulator of cell proliferation-like isoform X2 n=1 Tax=Bufo bufo TaxID=8384 RepID=UPI001ABE144E|nr:up-regulator of cell proliferation-like isoform X2 [Bufo bufo]